MDALQLEVIPPVRTHVLNLQTYSDTLSACWIHFFTISWTPRYIDFPPLRRSMAKNSRILSTNVQSISPT